MIVASIPKYFRVSEHRVVTCELAIEDQCVIDTCIPSHHGTPFVRSGLSRLKCFGPIYFFTRSSWYLGLYFRGVYCSKVNRSGSSSHGWGSHVRWDRPYFRLSIPLNFHPLSTSLMFMHSFNDNETSVFWVTMYKPLWCESSSHGLHLGQFVICSSHKDLWIRGLSSARKLLQVHWI